MGTLLIILLYAAALWFLASAAFSGVRFAPWLPSNTGAATRALALAQFVPDEHFLDLGSGDGRVVIEASRVHRCIASGVELSLPLYLISLLRASVGHSPARFYHGSLFNHDVSNADIVYVYGLPGSLNGDLRDKLELELPSGARVVSRAYEIDGWHLLGQSIGAHTWDTLYLYQI